MCPSLNSSLRTDFVGRFLKESKIRNIKWEKKVFLDALYWTSPCKLSELAKTWLNEDLKDILPHNAVTEDMVLDEKSIIGSLIMKYGKLIIL
jgi:hypothetical protein